MAQLALIQLDHYDPDELKRAMQIAFKKLELNRLFQPGERILIKPNMLAAVAPEKAVTPHPAVFAALAETLQECGVELSYGDSPAVDTPAQAARICGFEPVARKLGIMPADFSQSVIRDIPGGLMYRKTELAKGVDEADGLVSLAKLKTHALTAMTGVLKNQFGVIPGVRKAKLHAYYERLEDFSQMLADLNLLVRPRLAVMDAIVGMEGNGPRNGTPRKVGLLLVSVDCVAIDTAAAALIGLDPAALPYIQAAARSGLGEQDPSQISTLLIRLSDQAAATSEGRLDELIASLRISDFQQAEIQRSTMNRLNKLAGPLAKRFILNRPTIDPQLCTRCSVCVRECPVEPKALSQADPGAVPSFHYQRCIRCFCCQETCPPGAISVRRSLPGRLLDM